MVKITNIDQHRYFDKYRKDVIMILYKHSFDTASQKCIIEKLTVRESPKYYILTIDLPYTVPKVYRNGHWTSSYTRRISKDSLNRLTKDDLMFSTKPDKQLFYQLLIKTENTRIENLKHLINKSQNQISLLQTCIDRLFDHDSAKSDKSNT